MRRRWIIAATPLLVGVTITVVALVAKAAAGGYSRGDAIYVAATVGLVLAIVGAGVVALFALVRFIVWAGQGRSGGESGEADSGG